MKALSIKQPFAELILSGKKTIELRTWNTKFRGKFFIHASKSPDKKAMERFGYKDLPVGFILGEAELAEVKHYKNKEDFEKDSELHQGKTFSEYGFILKNIKRQKPKEAKGKLGFWEFK